MATKLFLKPHLLWWLDFNYMPQSPIVFYISTKLRETSKYIYIYIYIYTGMLVVSLISWHIETETKWPPFCRRLFRIHFLLWESVYFASRKCAPIGIISNRSVLAYVMAGRRKYKPLSEPKVIYSIEGYMRVSRPQWVYYTRLYSIIFVAHISSDLFLKV